MKFLLAATSAIALMTGIASAQETANQTTAGEAEAPITSDSSSAGYEADWQGGWFVTAHEITSDTDLTQVPEQSFAKWLDSDSNWKLTDYATYLPSERPLLLGGQYRTAYLNIAESGTYAFRMSAHLPQHPWFSPSLTCSAEMVFEGQSMITDDAILLHDTSVSKTSNISYGKDFGTEASSSWQADTVDLDLAAGLYQVSVRTMCREVSGYGDFSLERALAAFPEKRLATLLGSVGGYANNGTSHQDSLSRGEWNGKPQDIGSIEASLGIDWSLMVSRNGEDFRDLAYEEVVNDMNELGSVSDVNSQSDASKDGSSALVFSSGGKVEELNDDWSIGFIYRGLPTDQNGMSTDTSGRNVLYEGGTQFPTWNTFIGNGAGFKSSKATDRSSIVMESNFVARETGNWVIAIGISGKDSIDGWWRGCKLGIEIKNGRDWQELRSEYMTFGLDGENYLLAHATLDEGVYPIRFSSLCPMQADSLSWRKGDPAFDSYGVTHGGIKTGNKSEELHLDETGHVYKIYLKAPSDDGLRQPAATDFVIKGYPGLPSLRDAERKKAAAVKVTPKPTEPVEVKPDLKTEGDLNAEEIGAALQAAEVIKLNLSVEFESGSDQLTNAGRRTVAELAKALNHPALANSKFVIDGHTDSDGDDKSNFQLSMRRARTVLLEMVEIHGIKLQTTDQQQAGAPTGPEKMRFRLQAWGETQPIASNDTPEGKARNRRVTIFREE